MSNKKKLLILAVVGVLLFCLCIGISVAAWYFFLRDKGNPTVLPTTSVEVTHTGTVQNTVKPTPTTNIPRPAVLSTMYDDFSSNKNDWLNGPYDKTYSSGTRSIANGKYVWDITAKESMFTSVYATENAIENFEVGVDSKVTSLVDDIAFGFILKDTDGGFYGFLVSPGTLEYNFYYYDNETFTDLIDWEVSDAIHMTGVNTAKVLCLDGTFYLYINNELVNTVDDSAILKGDVGLIAEMYNEGDTGTYEFDNFYLTVYK